MIRTLNIQGALPAHILASVYNRPDLYKATYDAVKEYQKENGFILNKSNPLDAQRIIKPLLIQERKGILEINLSHIAYLIGDITHNPDEIKAMLKEETIELACIDSYIDLIDEVESLNGLFMAAIETE